MSRSLTDNQIAALVVLFKKGEKPLAISSRTGISLRTVYKYQHDWEEGLLKPYEASTLAASSAPSVASDVPGDDAPWEPLGLNLGGRPMRHPERDMTSATEEVAATAPETRAERLEPHQPTPDKETAKPEAETAPDAHTSAREVAARLDPMHIAAEHQAAMEKAVAHSLHHDRQVEDAVIRAVLWELEHLMRHWRKHHADLPPDITHELAMLRERIEGMTEIEEAMPPA